MNRRQMIYSTLAAAAFWQLGKPAHADVPPLPKEKLEELATHIVVGKVQDIYEVKETTGEYAVTRYVAEIVIETVEKGAELKNQKLVYARYWSQIWVAKSLPRPGTNGYETLPKRGDKVRVYMVKNGKNNHSETTDGGFDAVFPNGITPG